MHELAKQVIQGMPRAAARAISWIEDNHPEKNQLLKDLFPHTGRAYVLGITGSPGTGKSTLADRLIAFLREKGLNLGIIAVDPTSPFTGGAILGDRVRMQRHATDDKVFIRSMGTRGFLGGLARHTKEAVRVLDAYGCDVILVETVGVGQSELEIMHLADSTMVVLSPGAGDKMQAFKAGIMEIADIFVINKADLEGADKLAAQVSTMLDIVKQHAAWRPPLVKTIAAENQGIENVWKEIEKHRNYLITSHLWKQRRDTHLREEVEEIITYLVLREIQIILKRPEFQAELADIGIGNKDPYAFVEKVMEVFKKGGGSS